MSDIIAFQYNKREEWANGITHGVGVILSIIALITLLHKAISAQNLAPLGAYSVYSISLFLLYLASTCYHLCTSEKQKILFKKMDHICIYLLIAGSYTPFLSIAIPNGEGYLLLVIVWSLALIGILFKAFSKKRHLLLSVFTYLGMGWMAVFAKDMLAINLSDDSFWWLALGGIFYTSGVLFYLKKKLPYHHAIWHLFVLAGSISHFKAIHLISIQ